ncbi:VOC family protein [Mucilaginibacter myungsuensis]|uniref:VOC family protein n=1 Tax=Mucilaginibacter myungsuensis TaxID=649104 RepID=A0A929L096_9SPHI|nr:VOC family protein [Mucilaginibacter myungsuensis]MBE9662129.1 VOC family protein [Mucilaginibacter myungsuensis]MDN3599437.1 VOC family protein [Mucilaginibacter myungsuensis]
MPIKINHLQHIGIPVTDIKESEKFYQRLGFANAMTAQFDHVAGKGDVIMMQLGDIIVELYQMPEAALDEVRNRGNGHIDHIAFDVDDIDETFAAVKEAGFTIIELQPIFLQFWTKGCKYFNIVGPDGERLEFNQILK